jgi:hypothetical protein
MSVDYYQGTSPVGGDYVRDGAVEVCYYHLRNDTLLQKNRGGAVGRDHHISRRNVIQLPGQAGRIPADQHIATRMTEPIFSISLYSSWSGLDRKRTERRRAASSSCSLEKPNSSRISRYIGTQDSNRMTKN